MEQVDPLISVALLLASALAGGMIAHRLKQPVILGYMIIGMITGPNMLGLVTDPRIVEGAASMGLALLMFTLGMEVSLAQLREAGKIGILGGLAQVLITGALGTMAGLFIFSWTLDQSILLGLIISLSSTAICLKILMERGELNSVKGHIMIAILILQDISVVIMMVFLPLLGGQQGDMLSVLLLSTGKAVFVIGSALVLGQWVLPWLLGTVGGIRSRELFILTILVLCLGAMIETNYFGLSTVFGAFLIGMVLRSTRFVHQALADITPLRDIFATLFFVSIGMMLDPAFIMQYWPEILGMVGLIAAIKFIVVFSVVRLFNYSNRIAVITGAGLMQVSEFGFILAQNGVNTAIFSQHQSSLIISSAVLTMFLTPLFFSLAARLQQRLTSLRESSIANKNSQPAADSPGAGRIIIAGYGRVGDTISRGLEAAGLAQSIIDIDSERIAEAWDRHMHYIYGDASNIHVLLQADLQNASAIVITYPDPMAVQATVKNALTINPGLKILARFHRHADAKALTKLGVTELVNPELEAGFKFFKQVLKLTGMEKEERTALVDAHRQANQ
jgi:CPA2 family monovalent cation:H+ antiporter-2